MAITWLRTWLGQRPPARPRGRVRCKPGIEALEERSLLSAGGLDPTFGQGGMLSTDFGFQDGGASMAIQADGKIVVAGFAGQVNGNRDIALARYLPSGALDPDFGQNGLVRTDFGADERAYDVAVGPDGQIVIAGEYKVGGTAQFMVIRYQTDGSLTNNALSLVSFGAGPGVAYGVAVQPNGKIVAVGRFGVGVNSEFAVARLLPDGQPDQDFSTDGKDLPDIPGWATDVALQADGRIVLAGVTSVGQGFAVVRYDTSGILDNSFDGDGKATVSFGGTDYAQGVAVQPDGKIVVVGHTSTNGGDFALARFDALGGLDATFGNGGKLTTDFGGTYDWAYGVAVQADGRIVVAGQTELAAVDRIGLARYRTDGSLDAGFGTNGLVTIPVGGSSTAQAVAIQADGKIVAAGFSSGNFAVVRVDGKTILTGDVTAQVNVVRGKVRRTRRPGVVRQKVTLVNVSEADLAGPIYLVLDGLRRKVRLRNRAGVTSKQAPFGSAFAVVDVGDNVLSPGESRTVTLLFRKPLGRRVRYTPRVLAGVGVP